jgi:hypothetical protein
MLALVWGIRVEADAAARIDTGARRMLERAQRAIDDLPPGIDGFADAKVAAEQSTDCTDDAARP